MESLVSAGAFDSLMPLGAETAGWRSKLYNGVTDILQFGLRSWDDKRRGQSDLFGVATSVETTDFVTLPDSAPWSQDDMSQHEKLAVGFYLSVHPLDNYKETLDKLGILALADYEQFAVGQTVRVAGLVSGLQVRYSKKGNRFAIFRLEDQSGGIKSIIWGDTFGRMSSLLKEDELIIAEGRIEGAEGQEETLIINDLKLLADAQPLRAHDVTIRLSSQFRDEDYEHLFRLLNGHKGECSVTLKIPAGGIEAEIQTPHLRIRGSAKLEQELRNIGCNVDWVV